MARYDDLNTKTIGYLTFISAILLAVTILLLQALCYNWIDWQEETKLTKQSYTSSDEMIAAQKASLSGYGKVQVEVPIEPRRVMVFKPSNVLKARINGANGAGKS